MFFSTCRPLVVLGMVLGGCAMVLASEPDEPPAVVGDLPLVFETDFEADGLDDWEFTDANAWRITTVNGNRVLDQYQNSRYQPEVRSPLNIGLIKDVEVGDFVLDLKLKTTTRDYGHRDLCLFFGHQNPSRFYYVHLGQEADPHAHSVFLVNDEPRVSIAEDRTSGTPWTEDWHHARIVRKVDTGEILVYFDDMENPVMVARDQTFTHGRIGVGSFDDSGYFDEIRLWGRPADE